MAVEVQGTDYLPGLRYRLWADTHHSTSSTFRKAVWECRISYKKRGTCETGWLHDTELQACLAQFLLRRLFHDPDLVAAIGDALSSASTAHRGAVSTSMATTMTRAAQTLAAHPDDVNAHIAWGLMTRWRTLILEGTDRQRMEFVLPSQWHSRFG